MKSTPENKVKSQLKQYLDSIPGLWYYSATAGPYSTAGIPDIMGCYKGRLFGIEVKKPGGKPTKLQVMQMSKINAAGGFAIVFDGTDWEPLHAYFR